MVVKFVKTYQDEQNTFKKGKVTKLVNEKARRLISEGFAVEGTELEFINRRQNRERFLDEEHRTEFTPRELYLAKFGKEAPRNWRDETILNKVNEE